MNAVASNLAVFFGYALMAVFVQNAVFTRAFGVSRLTKLVTDSAVDSLVFWALLCLVQMVSAPLAFFANQHLVTARYWFRGYIRPLVLVVCATIAFGVVLLVVGLVKPRNQKAILAVLPMASFNTAVLGPMLISAAQSFNFVQTIGFALGSGLGYGVAILIVTEGQRKLNNRNVPATFKGLPINLIYIGILALAIYGLTGHRLPI